MSGTFKRHYLFFSTMLASKGAPYFRSRLLDLVVEEFTAEVDTIECPSINLIGVPSYYVKWS
ncbi:hypothetical protein J7E81_12310 [Bacillus sp. ISL-18]|nr:hypothetical protein [Bacillus sp. ISL-18]MBT2656005.1 hypothetical protein [Bacillus sp. ISL-18]